MPVMHGWPGNSRGHSGPGCRPSSAVRPCAACCWTPTVLADGADHVHRRHRDLHRRRPDADPVRSGDSAPAPNPPKSPRCSRSWPPASRWPAP